MWVCAVFSQALPCFSLFGCSDAINFRPHTHTHKRRHLYKLHIRHVGRSTNQSQPSRLANFRDTHRRTDTRTLVTVALLNFQTHAKLNPRMCLTFALFWLSGPWVFSLMSLCLFHAECAAPHVRVCVCGCALEILVVCLSVCVCLCNALFFFSFHSSLLFSLFYYTIKPQQLETWDTRLDTAVAFVLTRFSFSLYPLCKKT